MRRILLFTLTALCLASPLASLPSPALAQAPGTELLWRWTKGAVHRYETRSTQRMRMKTMGVHLDVTAETDGRFALHIDDVAADGSARATLVLERFRVRDAKGGKVASLENLPPTALRTPVVIDRKGHFRFERLVWLLVDDAGDTMLVGGSVSPDGASARARAGGEEVSLYARFDRKSGKLSAGYSVKTVGRKTTRVRVKENARRIDLIPEQFLSLLALPDGPLAKGDKVTARVADWQFDTTVQELDRKKGATIRVVISTPGDGTGTRNPGAKVKARTAAGDADVETPPVPGMPEGMGMPAGMGPPPGMMPPGMGVPGASTGAQGQPAMPSLKMRGDVKLQHDVAAGFLRKIEGTIATEQRIPMPGMPTGEIDSDTMLEMVRVK